MKRIGLSTGMYYKFFSSLEPGVIKRCHDISTSALEICCVGGICDKGFWLDDLPAELLSDIDFLSIHAPSSHISYGDNRFSYDILDALQRAWDKLTLDHIVFHPDTIKDWNIFRSYDFNIAIENMDNRKAFGTKPGQLQEVFDKIDCGFVLDLNHCYSNDQSMLLADSFLKEFSDRLVEIHISGYTSYHEMLHQTKQEAIERYLGMLDAPIIIESVCTATYQAQDEFDYICSHV
ncbi:MAG: hypothetical protein WCO55_04935 [Candidatus Falkowbacteria bacterium]